MVVIRFLSYIAKNFGKKEIEIQLSREKKLNDLIIDLKNEYKYLNELLSDDSEISIILNNNNLLIPRDLNILLKNSDELVFAPVVSGG